MTEAAPTGLWVSFHRRVWQRLPRLARRAVLLETAALVAPRPGRRPVPATGPFIVAGPLHAATGIGESARLCLDALKRAGEDVFGIDLSGAFQHGMARGDYAFRDGRHIKGAGTILCFVNGPYVPIALLAMGRRFIRSKTIIGYWAWELPSMPADWRYGLKFVHEIWAPSTFTAAAIRPFARQPVRVLPPPLSAKPEGAEVSWPRPTVDLLVLTMFNMNSGFSRKNPLAAVAAFRRAFGDDPQCRLIVKVTNGRSEPLLLDTLIAAIGGARNIELIDHSYTAAQTAALVRAADVVLSLHRSEGFGLVIAEAMRYGKAVVATNWSAPTDFMTVENSCPVGWRLIPAQDAQATYDLPHQSWAEPDVDDAARQLRRLRDPILRAGIGGRAAADAMTLFSEEHFVAAFHRYVSCNGRDPS